MKRPGAQDTRPRGGALFALSGVMVAWAALRLVTWAPPFEPASLSAIPLPDDVLGMHAPVAEAEPRNDDIDSAPERVVPLRIEPILPDWQLRPLPERIPSQSSNEPGGSPYGRVGAASRAFAGADALIGHVLLLQAGYRASAAAGDALPPLYRDTPMVADNAPVTDAPRAAAEMRRTPAPSRWSMDAWALWREDSDSPLLSGRPSYGRSQVGAVLRYRLAPSNGHRPQVYLRGSAALEGRLEREVALGASLRPVPTVPVRFAAETRVSETVAGTELRSAGFAVTEFPPVDLPGGMTAEAYLQAGYVSGEFATAFVDGQARVTRPLAEVDDFRLEAGAGAWGGAQEDAGRLDVGPSASVSFRLGEGRGRLSADYRFRVAGDARPASGPALTLSAGF